jgi:outer membrane protein
MAIFERQSRGSMNYKIARFLAMVVVILSAAAGAQTQVTTLPTSAIGPAKIGIVNIQSVIVGTNEGQKEIETLEKRFEPRRSELKTLSDEIDALKKQLDTQGAKLNDEARAALVKQIDSKQKSLGRAEEDAQTDFATQQNEIVQKILSKLIPIIDKYAKDNGLTFIIDASKPWPEWPLVWGSPSADISKAVVDLYNASSGVPAPTTPLRPSGTINPTPDAKSKRP